MTKITICSALALLVAGCVAAPQRPLPADVTSKNVSLEGYDYVVRFRETDMTKVGITTNGGDLKMAARAAEVATGCQVPTRNISAGKTVFTDGRVAYEMGMLC